MSVTLEMDEETLNCLPLGPGERERAMRFELACRFYANAWLTLGRARGWRVWTNLPLAKPWPSAASRVNTA